MLITTDNNCGKLLIDCNHSSNFQKIANTKIGDLVLENQTNLLVFPQDFNQYGDKISEECIFTLKESQLTTGNIMGFVGINGSELTIQSRFAKEEGDYFLHYMLQKVFSINLFDLKHSANQESIFDFLLYLFPYYLKKALRQGLFKEYFRNSYNDSNVKGTIDVNAHIRRNIPFSGKIAYSTREHRYDNNVTQLIRHTVEYINKHKFNNNILINDIETQNCVLQIKQATPSFNSNQLIQIINKNIRIISHPYYSEYSDLQKICLQILRYEGLKYGQDKDKVYGLLFDGAWLWEEYINTFLSKIGFNHPKNKTSEGAIFLFRNSTGKRYPDFWKDNFILDAKYKRLSDKGSGDIRNDMNQIISYMYILKAQKGGFISPIEKDKYYKSFMSYGELNGYGGEVNLWLLPIPQQVDDFNNFCIQMQHNEVALSEHINNSHIAIHS